MVPCRRIGHNSRYQNANVTFVTKSLCFGESKVFGVDTKICCIGRAALQVQVLLKIHNNLGSRDISEVPLHFNLDLLLNFVFRLCHQGAYPYAQNQYAD
jgi:hypothetical protein